MAGVLGLQLNGSSEMFRFNAAEVSFKSMRNCWAVLEGGLTVTIRNTVVKYKY